MLITGEYNTTTPSLDQLLSNNKEFSTSPFALCAKHFRTGSIILPSDFVESAKWKSSIQWRGKKVKYEGARSP
jgi:hypothetical protein